MGEKLQLKHRWRREEAIKLSTWVLIALFRLGQALGYTFHQDKEAEEDFYERALKRDDTFAYSLTGH